jgi:hypothetical protein
MTGYNGAFALEQKSGRLCGKRFLHRASTTMESIGQRAQKQVHKWFALRPAATSCPDLLFTSTPAGRRQRTFHAEPFATNIRPTSGLSP